MILNRRQFMATAASAAAAWHLEPHAPHTVYVRPEGNDAAPGTVAAPVQTVQRALDLARSMRGKQVGEAALILLGGGVYELAHTLQIGPDDGGTAAMPLRLEAMGGERPILSGGTRLSLAWRQHKGGILKASVPADTTTDQLFVNGVRQTLARYPSFNANARYLNGYAADATSPERTRLWKHPEDGYVHGLQQSLWGSLHYRIRGRSSDGELNLEGGWQIDRDQPMHREFRFVEGLLEELDTPGEWYLDPRNHEIYFYPPVHVDVRTADVRVVRLEQLVRVGDTAGPLTAGVRFRGITFQHTLRTFMKTREQLARSDWRIFRGGAMFIENASAVTVDDCTFDQPGGNALFVSGHARNIRVHGCHVNGAGASGLCFVGRASALRSPALGYNSVHQASEVDPVAGPREDSFPADCSVEECLITQTGRFEKQSAGIEIQTAQAIMVRNCSIYDVPRAGINLGDGAFGGHLVEGCDVFDTVRETSDHGAFNSWGRDRWWHLQDAPEDALLDGPLSTFPTLDAVLPTILRRSRWVCEHGWDIDLDDGSSNIRIEQNLCLCGGIKLREGFFRTVENNITVHNTLHVHVWPATSRDVVMRNIFFVPYRPVRPRGWGDDVDYNLLHTPGAGPTPATQLARISGQDTHSLSGDAGFANAAAGDFRLTDSSAALALGFIPFNTGDFGVTLPHLRRIARIPDLARILPLPPETLRTQRHRDPAPWMGAKVRNLTGLGEMSELGAPSEMGVVLESIDSASAASAAGLQPHDLLIGANGKDVPDTKTLLQFTSGWNTGQAIPLRVLRQQRPVALMLHVP